MARIPERKFDPARPVYARKTFTANGRKLTPGTELDWKKLAVDQRRVRNMFDTGYIGHDEPKAATASNPTDTHAAVKKIVEDEVTPKRIDEAYTPERKDDLDAIDDLKELRAIADEIGAPYKVSKADQRQAIRDKRAEG